MELGRLFATFYRTIILYTLTLVVVRIMGKRSIAQLAPFDLVVMIIVGSVAAIPIEEIDRDIWSGLVSILTLGLLQYILAVLTMRSRLIEKVTQGVPTVLVRNGQILEDNMEKERVTEADLNITLREQGIDDIGDVEIAALEPHGLISVIKKKEAQPLTAKDISSETLEEMSLVIQENLARMQFQMKELQAQIRQIRRKMSSPIEKSTVGRGPVDR